MLKFFTGTQSIITIISGQGRLCGKAGCWKKIWINILTNNLKYLDLSSIEFDGSHTPAKNGGDAVGYQGRKASNTTNALFISDNQGVMLAMSTPQEGQHHDLFQIQVLFEEICTLLKEAEINLKGLFLNADRTGGPAWL